MLNFFSISSQISRIVLPVLLAVCAQGAHAQGSQSAVSAVQNDVGTPAEFMSVSGATPGDIFTKIPQVSSGKADRTSGSNFPTIEGGMNKAQILQLGSRRREQLMQYTEVHPYPNVTHITIDGRDYQYIAADDPAGGTKKRNDKFDYGGISTVRVISRYFVILAVVVATILMAFGAYGIILGHENAGSKVVFCAGGLMLLLMSFTMWKVLQANMVSLNDGGITDENQVQLPRQILLPDEVPRSAGAPTINFPLAPIAAPRSGIPVAPLSGR